MTRRRLSDVILELRERRRFTQEVLAQKARVTPGYVAQLELGIRKNPSLDVLRRLARALGVPLSKLLDVE